MIKRNNGDNGTRIQTDTAGISFVFSSWVKFAGYKLFNKHSPFYGSADIINVCNLHCEHCYWWLNRKEEKDLTLEQWKNIIDEKFKKNHVFMVTLVGGEPLMRKDVIELFVKEFPKRAYVVTNGTYPIPYLKDIYFYWISIDGDKKITIKFAVITHGKLLEKMLLIMFSQMVKRHGKTSG